MRSSRSQSSIAAPPPAIGMTDGWIDLSLVLLTLVAPLFLGGRHAIGIWIYGLAALPAAAALVWRWATVAPPRLPLVLWCLIAAWLLLPLVQASPLGANYTSHVGRGYASLAMPAGSDQWQSSLGTTFSLVPTASRNALTIIAAYVTLFLALQVRLRDQQDVRRLIVLLTIGGSMMAALALAQATLGSDRFLWLYDHPTRDAGEIPRGPFQNENHLCSLLAMTLPLAVLLLIPRALLNQSHSSSHHSHHARRSRPVTSTAVSPLQWFAAATLILIFLVVYATPSRGGAVLVACGIAFPLSLVAWHWLTRQLTEHSPHRQVAAWGTYLALWGTGLAVGMTQMSHWSYWRAKIWQVNVAMFSDFPLFGIGIGAHRHVYRAYLDEYFPQTFTHAESSLVQILSETGLAGCILLASAAGLLVHRMYRTLASPTAYASRWTLTAVTASLLVAVTHACFDFPWHIPACATPLIALTALAFRLPELNEAGAPSTGATTSRPDFAGQWSRPTVWGPVIVACALLLALATSARPGWQQAQGALAWDAYRRLSPDDEEAEATTPPNRDQQQLAALVRCVSLDPTHVQANVRLAQHLLLRSAKAKSAKERDRLLQQSASLALRAAKLAPTHSEPMLIVAETEIARNGDVSAQEARFRYSLRLRPVDGRVLGRLALIELLAGDVTASDACWRAALERDPARLASTIKMLRVFQPPGEILRRYEPSLRPAEELLRQVAGTEDSQSAREVLHYVALQYAAAADEDPRDTIAEQHYATAYQYASQTYDDPFVVALLERRIARNPLVLDAQLLLVEHLVRVGDTQRIDEVLTQCTLLAPNDDRVRQLRVQASKLALRTRLER